MQHSPRLVPQQYPYDQQHQLPPQEHYYNNYQSPYGESRLEGDEAASQYNINNDNYYPSPTGDDPNSGAAFQQRPQSQFQPPPPPPAPQFQSPYTSSPHRHTQYFQEEDAGSQYNRQSFFYQGQPSEQQQQRQQGQSPLHPPPTPPQQQQQQQQRPVPNRGLDDTPSSPGGPLLDHSHLRPGKQAALLSHERTLELYRANAKKTQNPEVQFEFAVFMIEAAKTSPIPAPTKANVIEVEKAMEKRDDLIREATSLLKRLADRGHPASQYFLADCYANGLGTVKNRQDFDKAYPLFVLAAKHGHPDASYRAGTCCENGWGCRRESAKAVQFYRKAAAAQHPGAMYRLGIAELNGELGLSKSPREGVKWLKRSAEHATAEFPHALHELALIHERGIENVVFVDYEYAVELLAQAAELGNAPSAYRLGECYEYGKLGCPQDAALSIHYYNIAAQQNHRDACFALTAWYLVGSPGVLPQSDTEAYLWAKRAAECNLVKAMYAVGYFTEVGIGVSPSLQDATVWYKRAAELGDSRAQQRLKSQTGPLPVPNGPGGVLHRGTTEQTEGTDGKCLIM